MSVREVSWETKPLGLPDSAEMPRYQWTRDQYHDLMTSGILKSGAPYELLAGEIVRKVTSNQPHVIACRRTNRQLAQIFGIDFVQILAPIGIGTHSEPEPDIAVTVLTQGQYLIRGTPKARDLRLAIKVSDSTLQFDLTTKAHLYARAGVLEYWVLDTNGRQLHVFCDPTADGHISQTVYGESESVAPLGAPGVPVLVGPCCRNSGAEVKLSAT